MDPTGDALRVYRRGSAEYRDITSADDGGCIGYEISEVLNDAGGIKVELSGTTVAMLHEWLDEGCRVELWSDGNRLGIYEVDRYSPQWENLSAQIECAGILALAKRNRYTGTVTSTLEGIVTALVAVAPDITGVSLSLPDVMVSVAYVDKFVYDALTGLSTVYGFDYYVDGDGVLVASTSQTAVTHTLALNDGAWAYQSDHSTAGLVNRIRVDSASGSWTFDDAPSQATYGIRESIIKVDGVVDYSAAAAWSRKAFTGRPERSIRARVDYDATIRPGAVVDVTGLEDGRTYVDTVLQTSYVSGSKDMSLVIGARNAGDVPSGLITTAVTVDISVTDPDEYGSVTISGSMLAADDTVPPGVLTIQTSPPIPDPDPLPLGSPPVPVPDEVWTATELELPYSFAPAEELRYRLSYAGSTCYASAVSAVVTCKPLETELQATSTGPVEGVYSLAATLYVVGLPIPHPELYTVTLQTSDDEEVTWDDVATFDADSTTTLTPLVPTVARYVFAAVDGFATSTSAVLNLDPDATACTISEADHILTGEVTDSAGAVPGNVSMESYSGTAWVYVASMALVAGAYSFTLTTAGTYRVVYAAQTPYPACKSAELVVERDTTSLTLETAEVQATGWGSSVGANLWRTQITGTLDGPAGATLQLCSSPDPEGTPDDVRIWYVVLESAAPFVVNPTSPRVYRLQYIGDALHAPCVSSSVTVDAIPAKEGDPPTGPDTGVDPPTGDGTGGIYSGLTRGVVTAYDSEANTCTFLADAGGAPWEGVAVAKHVTVELDVPAWVGGTNV